MRFSSALGVAAAGCLSLWLSFGATGCQSEDEEPVAVARKFAGAAQRGDVKAMLPLLERGVVESLESAAERASDQVGGRRSIEPHEMLQVVAAEPGFAIASAELIDNDGTSAHVELVGPEDQRHRLELVLQDGQWRVRLPVPVGSVRESS
jgi:hypothetical protein